MPEEPCKNKNLTICTPSKSTCCTPEIETQMQMTSRLGIERSVQDQIILIRQQFDNFATIFKNEFRLSINTTKKSLNQMFEKSYGPFYIQHRQVCVYLFFLS
uniref:Uncharacterized protein n=1 Tax=Panagrolaimus sp. PS1159 TaxID=55785 RepID=A0AC35FIC0_9BILA